MNNQLVLRNDSDKVYNIPGIGEIQPGQRVSINGYVPPINFLNYPGLVDVLDEEANGDGRDYEQNPEVPYEPGQAGGQLSSRKAPAAAEENE